MHLIILLLGASSLMASLSALNWWFDLVEWRSAMYAMALVAIAASVNHSAKLWFRILTNIVLVIGALAIGTLDERQRKRDAVSGAEKRAIELAERRYEEYQEEIQRLNAVETVIEVEAAKDEHASREALSIDAVRRINRLR